MDFSIIERHPWATTGIVLGGGFLLFRALRGSGGGSTGGNTIVNAGPSDSQIAADAQTQSINAQLQALQIQSGTQVTLAGISSDVQKLQIAAAQNVTNKQTDAQTLLGLGTLQTQLDLAKVSAGVQLATLDAIVRAFTGGAPNTPAPIPVASNPVNNQTVAAPGYQMTPPVPVSISNPSPSSPYVPPGTIIPGGTQLVPYPNLIPVGAWPDANIVRSNTQAVVDWENATLTANAANNRNQCLSNAELSRGYPNYAALVAACG